MEPELLEKYADVLLWGMFTARMNSYQTGDVILIRYDYLGRELAEKLFKKLLEKGMHPIQRVNMSSQMEYSFYSIGKNFQLVFIPPGEEELYSGLHGLISILAPESLTHLQKVNPEKIGKSILAYKRLRDILDERENQGNFGWTLALMGTEALAKEAGLSLKEYNQQIIKACYLDYKDPVKKWQEIFELATEIKRSLNSLKIKKVHVESDRIDLRVSIGPYRRWVGISGHNIPSFEIFTSPDWRGVNGTFFMNLPSFRKGNIVKNLKLEFKDGKVIKAEADTGLEFVKKQIEIDSNACKVGEFSLTDKRFSRINKFMAHTLYDENFGGEFGNCHIALGASYSETYIYGGKNLSLEKKEELGFNDSALHWDLVNTEPKRVVAELEGGERRTIYEDGLFII